MKHLVFSILFLILASYASGQDNEIGTRYWYSAYVHKKLNYRWSVDNFTLIGMRSSEQNFWLAQSNFGANYRVNRFWTLSAGYGHSLYKHSAWWESRYPQKPNFLNTVSFHSISLAAKRQDNISDKLRLTQKFTTQQFFPKFEKYQIRLQYSAKLSYRNRDLPAGLKPFVQGALYYYHNGTRVDYFDEEFEPIYSAPPNGLHRMRLKFGATFKPVKANKNMSMTIYYGLNKELNLLGNDINFQRPADREDRSLTTLPFNDYGIIGVQVNFFL